MTFGANDRSWADIITQCYVSTFVRDVHRAANKFRFSPLVDFVEYLIDELFEKEVTPEDIPYKHGVWKTDTCTKANPGYFIDKLLARVPEDTLVQYYRDALLNVILASKEMHRKNVTILVNGYYQFLPRSTQGVEGCPDLLHLKDENLQYLDFLLTHGNELIQRAVREVNLITDRPYVHYVDTYRAFEGHLLCSKDPWVHGTSILMKTFLENNGGVLEDGPFRLLPPNQPRPPGTCTPDEAKTGPTLCINESINIY